MNPSIVIQIPKTNIFSYPCDRLIVPSVRCFEAVVPAAPKKTLDRVMQGILCDLCPSVLGYM